jgi:hypothetical protein
MTGAIIRNNESYRNITLGKSLRLRTQLNDPAMKPLRNLGRWPRLDVLISVHFAASLASLNCSHKNENNPPRKSINNKNAEGRCLLAESQDVPASLLL